MAEESNKKPKVGGRTKGTPNKKTILLEEKASELGVDLFEVICLFAKGDWKSLGYKEEKYMTQSNEHGDFYKYTIDPSVRAKCALEGANYLYPKRKAIEHSGKVETPEPEKVSNEELDARIEEKLKGLK